MLIKPGEKFIVAALSEEWGALPALDSNYFGWHCIDYIYIDEAYNGLVDCLNKMLRGKWFSSFKNTKLAVITKNFHKHPDALRLMAKFYELNFRIITEQELEEERSKNECKTSRRGAEKRRRRSGRGGK